MSERRGTALAVTFVREREAAHETALSARERRQVMTGRALCAHAHTHTVQYCTYIHSDADQITHTEKMH